MNKHAKIGVIKDLNVALFTVIVQQPILVGFTHGLVSRLEQAQAINFSSKTRCLFDQVLALNTLVTQEDVVIAAVLKSESS
jgi:hypothetical protein